MYSLNLFDLAPNQDYFAYQRDVVAFLDEKAIRLLAIGLLAPDGDHLGDTPARQVMILAEWSSKEAFEAFLADPALAELHRLRESGTERYVWWLYDRIESLQPLFDDDQRRV